MLFGGGGPHTITTMERAVLSSGEEPRGGERNFELPHTQYQKETGFAASSVFLLMKHFLVYLLVKQTHDTQRERSLSPFSSIRNARRPDWRKTKHTNTTQKENRPTSIFLVLLQCPAPSPCSTVLCSWHANVNKENVAVSCLLLLLLADTSGTARRVFVFFLHDNCSSNLNASITTEPNTTSQAATGGLRNGAGQKSSHSIPIPWVLPLFILERKFSTQKKPSRNPKRNTRRPRIRNRRESRNRW